MITRFQQCVPHNLHLGVLQVPLVTCLRWCCHPCTTPWGKTWLGLASLWLLGPRQPSYLGWVPRGCRGPGGCATWGVGLTYVRGGWTLLGWASVGLWHLLGIVGIGHAGLWNPGLYSLTEVSTQLILPLICGGGVEACAMKQVQHTPGIFQLPSFI